MTKLALDPSTLTAFENAAAGHDGVLSDPTGALVIKPCTAHELSFYESVVANHQELLPYIPTFMGTLQLNTAGEAAEVKPNTTAATLDINDPGPMHGKKLGTSLSIVLENVAAGFKRPNVLDVKLGARLWDDKAESSKRARLDKVAAETTSGSLGFRVAGMKIWRGSTPVPAVDRKDEGVEFDAASNSSVYNKMYGRKFSADNVINAFKEFVLVPSAGIDETKAAKLVQRFTSDIENIQKILENSESRMYSASILMVYEGDSEAFDAALKAEAEAKDKEDDEDDDDDDEESVPKVASTKLIDFAHASWTPGLGPDENLLQGVRSTVKIFKNIAKELETSK